MDDKMKRLLPFLALALASCSSASNDNNTNNGFYVGKIDAQKIMTDFPKFVKHQSDVDYSEQQIQYFKDLAEPTNIKIFFGQWCHDSQREVPRVIQLIEKANNPNLTVEFMALDITKSDPDGLAKQHNIRRTPTIIVYQNGEEIDRILEFPRVDWPTDIKQILTK